jgi:hypothetical protein
MARSLNKKYFGARNIGSTSTTSDDGIGGQGVASVTVVQGSGMTGTSKTITISAPDLPKGVQATATSSVAAGIITITVTETGSGYITAPTVTVTGGTLGTSYTYTAVLTVDTGAVGSATNDENAITMTARLTGGSAGLVDIIRQVSTRRYKVTDGTRTGIIELKSSVATAAGEGSIAATDSAGGQYFVTKLTGRKATVTRAGGSGHLYATGEAAPWSFNAPATIYLQIANA